MHTDFVLDALEQALHARQLEQHGSLIHHSDRGSQYVSIRYTERLAEAGIEPSVGSKGDSYDNALAETINGLYKAEVIHRQTWKTREAVEAFETKVLEDGRDLDMLLDRTFGEMANLVIAMAQSVVHAYKHDDKRCLSILKACAKDPRDMKMASLPVLKRLTKEQLVEIGKEFGISGASMSHHFTVLRHADLIRVRRQGQGDAQRSAPHRVDPPGAQIGRGRGGVGAGAQLHLHPLGAERAQRLGRVERGVEQRAEILGQTNGHGQVLRGGA